MTVCRTLVGTVVDARSEVSCPRWKCVVPSQNDFAFHSIALPFTHAFASLGMHARFAGSEGVMKLKSLVSAGVAVLGLSYSAVTPACFVCIENSCVFGGGTGFTRCQDESGTCVLSGFPCQGPSPRWSASGSDATACEAHAMSLANVKDVVMWRQGQSGIPVHKADAHSVPTSALHLGDIKLDARVFNLGYFDKLQGSI